MEFIEEPPWYSDMGELELWDLPALSEYLTRKPPEFPLFRSVDLELRLNESFDNEDLAEALSLELSVLKDAGLLRMFCDEM